jgi:hypothetical protein
MNRPAHLPNTAQSLGALLKSARDIMREDGGFIGDLGGGPRQDEQDLQDAKKWKTKN